MVNDRDYYYQLTTTLEEIHDKESSIEPNLHSVIEFCICRIAVLYRETLDRLEGPGNHLCYRCEKFNRKG